MFAFLEEEVGPLTQAHQEVVKVLELVRIEEFVPSDKGQADCRRLELLHFTLPEDERFKERSTAERVNGRLKDEFGGRFVRVRGHAKVLTHLMFGLLALTADQLLRLVT